MSNHKPERAATVVRHARLRHICAERPMGGKARCSRHVPGFPAARAIRSRYQPKIGPLLRPRRCQSGLPALRAIALAIHQH
jgi:hypothetical protein